jgi:hypothetical protein
MATNWQIGRLIQNRWQIYKILKGSMGIAYVFYEFNEPSAAKTFQDASVACHPSL